MVFGGVFDGNYVVWHERPAQIDVHLNQQLSVFSGLDLTIAISKYNPTPVAKLYVKSYTYSSLVYVATLTITNPPSLPSDGSFVDAVYSATFASMAAYELRIVVTKDGANGQEMTPIKKYTLYNGGIAQIGGSKFKVSELGWQTGEVFKTIFKYLDAPISVEHTVNIDTETSGQLPEARIRNDNLLARVADNEFISGTWDFGTGQLLVPRGANLPVGVPAIGRLFQRTSDNNIFISDGAQWVKLVREDALQAKTDFSWVFTRHAMVPPGGYLKMGESPTSQDDGISVPLTCYLAAAMIEISSVDMDGNGAEIIRNGSAIGAVNLVSGTRKGNQTFTAPFSFGDELAIRMRGTNLSSLDSPKVTVIFRGGS